MYKCTLVFNSNVYFCCCCRSWYLQLEKEKQDLPWEMKMVFAYYHYYYYCVIIIVVLMLFIILFFLDYYQYFSFAQWQMKRAP